MVKHYGIILHPELPSSLRLILENYLFHLDDQPFLLSRSVSHVGAFVALDTLKNDGSNIVRQTLIPCGSIVAIVDMTGEQHIQGFDHYADS